MAENSMKPRIRFKGYTDAWEQRKLGEVANIQKGQQLGKAEMSNNGAFYVLNGGMEPSGYTNQYNTFANTISISEGGNSCGYVSLNLEQFWSGGHNYTLQNPKIDTFFLYQWLKRHEKGIMALRVGSGLPNIQKSALQDVNVAYPKKSEQRAIAEILNKIDNLITLHQRKYDKFVNIKKALLEKMFPQGNEMTPKIRFKGFTDAWEQRKLGEVGKAQSGVGFPDREQGGKTGVPFYKVSDMNNAGNEHEMCSANNYVSEAQCKKNGWMPITEISVVFAKVGAAIMLNRKRLVRISFLLDNNTMAYKFGTEWDIDFGKTLFERIDLTDLVQIGALPSYNATDVECVEISMPDKPEQHRIGVFFKQLDNLITLHQRQLEKLKNIKSALLEKMFV